MSVLLALSYVASVQQMTRRRSSDSECNADETNDLLEQERLFIPLNLTEKNSDGGVIWCNRLDIIQPTGNPINGCSQHSTASWMAQQRLVDVCGTVHSPPSVCVCVWGGGGGAPPPPPPPSLPSPPPSPTILFLGGGKKAFLFSNFSPCECSTWNPQGPICFPLYPTK